MKMKLLFSSAAVILMGITSQAQTGGYIKGGVNFANISVTNNGRVDQSNQLTSFHVGVVGDFKLGTRALSLQPGILYTGKGAKVERGTDGSANFYRQSFNPRYIEVPVNLVVRLPLGKTSGIFIGAGPYAAVGVGGNVKTRGSVLGVGYNNEYDIKFSDDNPTTFNQEEGSGYGIIRRFDYGINGTAGIEGKKLLLGVNYGLGLAKIQSGTSSGTDNNDKFRTVSLSLGFKF